jgi:hypothetical protein
VLVTHRDLLLHHLLRAPLDANVLELVQVCGVSLALFQWCCANGAVPMVDPCWFSSWCARSPASHPAREQASQQQYLVHASGSLSSIQNVPVRFCLMQQCAWRDDGLLCLLRLQHLVEHPRPCLELTLIYCAFGDTRLELEAAFLTTSVPGKCGVPPRKCDQPNWQG